MKKILLPLLVSVLVVSLSAQTQSGYVPFHQYFLNSNGNIQKSHGNARDISYGEIAYMHYAPVNGNSWIYSDSGEFYFGQANPDTTPIFETSGTYFVFGNTSWDTSGQFTNTVDYANSQIATTTGQVEDTGTKAWTNSYLYTNTYNSIGYLGAALFQTWSGSAWVDSSQYSYVYNVSAYDSVNVVQSGSTLQNDTQYLYTFNGYENTELITQTWNGTGWTNLYKQANSFDANGNNYQSFVTVWNGTGWNNYALIIRGYDLNNELVSYVSELWNANSGTYINSYQEAYAWVLSNNTQFANYNWDTTTSAWIPNSQNTYSFDNNHNVINEIDLTYTNGAFVNGALYYYYYQGYQVSGIKNVVNDLNISLFPNPSTGYATINYSSQNSGNILLNVYDAQGNLLKQQKASTTEGINQVPVNLSNYAAGNYFVQVVDAASGKGGVLKMVKQ